MRVARAEYDGLYIGDWIVASGQEDGTAMAIDPALITLRHRIIGKAWESSNDRGTKRMNTVIGLDQSNVNAIVISGMQKDINEL